MSSAACPQCGGEQSVSALGDVICENGCHKESSAATASSFDRVEILGRLRAVESGELTTLERRLIEALEQIAAVPEWWQGKIAREALSRV